MMPDLRCRVATSVFAALISAAAASAQVTLSPTEMRELAGQAVVQGQPALAYDLAGALVSRDDRDLNAHLIRSRAARDLGRSDEAVEHARVAWALADTPDEKYAASLANAQALSSAGRRTAAQLWLRRAVQLAPTDQLKTRAAQDFKYVRARNPWATALRFSVAPSSNINNGSRNETSELFDLPFEFQLEGEARALSGVEISTGFSSRYRLVSNDRKRTDLQFGVTHRTYVLSDEAKDIAPDADGADFATTSAFAGLQETYRLTIPKAQIGWNARVGATWYGGEELLKYARLGASYQHVLGPRGLASVDVSREAQDGKNGRDDATIWSGRLGYGMSLANGDRLSVSMSFSQAKSDADYLDYTQREVAVRYGMAKPVGPFQLQFGVSFGDKNHDRSRLTSDGRQETTTKASVTAALPDIEYFGFVPTVTMVFERTDANVDLYETENYGIQLGIRSAF